MHFVTPDHPQLRIDDPLKKFLETTGVQVQEFNSLDQEIDGGTVLQQADCFYMTRIQREHNSDETEKEINSIDLEPFRLTPERVAGMKSYAPIMHPFPRDSVVGEIPTSIDADPRAMYFRQARNGMWARAALLVHLFDVNEELNYAHSQLFPASR